MSVRFLSYVRQVFVVCPSGFCRISRPIHYIKNLKNVSLKSKSTPSASWLFSERKANLFLIIQAEGKDERSVDPGGSG